MNYYDFDNYTEEDTDYTWLGFDEPLKEDKPKITIYDKECAFSNNVAVDYGEPSDYFCCNKKKSKKKKSKKSKKKNKKISSKKKASKKTSKPKKDKKVLSNDTELINTVNELKSEVSDLKRNHQDDLNYMYQLETKMLWTLVSILKPETTKLIPDITPVYQITEK